MVSVIERRRWQLLAHPKDCTQAFATTASRPQARCRKLYGSRNKFQSSCSTLILPSPTGISSKMHASGCRPEVGNECKPAGIPDTGVLGACRGCLAGFFEGFELGGRGVQPRPVIAGKSNLYVPSLAEGWSSYRHLISRATGSESLPGLLKARDTIRSCGVGISREMAAEDD